MRRQCLQFAVLFFNAAVFAQTDSALISTLLADIEAMQVKQDGGFYKGAVPSYRKGAGFTHNHQPDNKIFYTGIITFTFSKLPPYSGDDNKATAFKMIKNVATDDRVATIYNTPKINISVC